MKALCDLIGFIVSGLCVLIAALLFTPPGWIGLGIVACIVAAWRHAA